MFDLVRECKASQFGIAAAILWSCLACGGNTSAEDDASDISVQEIWFVDSASAAGIDFEHVRAEEIRYWFPEIMSGGAAWLDYDQDGDLDLYLIQGGHLGSVKSDGPGNRLYQNQGSGTFQNVTGFAGVGDQEYGMGAAVGDYDGDGHPDIYVTNVGANGLYKNQGDGTFNDVTEQAGVGHPGWGSSACFLDYDADGYLDLYLANYVDWSPEREIDCFAGLNERDYCHPSNYNAPAADVLYRNLGNGAFEDVTRAAGIALARGNGLGVAYGDFDLDGWLDIYVANDGDPNQLWRNNGDGTFTDRGVISGSAVNRYGIPEAGMGVVPVDLENDGDLDLFMTHLRDETNTLYINDDGILEDATVSTGLSVPSIRYTGFGTGFADFDHDGALDLYIVNGRVGKNQQSLGKDLFGETNQLFRGLRDGRFAEISPVGGTDSAFVETSRAAAFGDYDGDGDIDLAVVNNGGHFRLLQNLVGDRGRWVMFRVIDRHGHEAVGARVSITTSSGIQWRQVQSAYSYLASNDPRVHFGLADADSAEQVVVVWSRGHRETFGSFAAGAVHTLHEGTGSPTLHELRR